MHEPRPALPDEGERFSRRQRAILAVFAACLFASLFYFVHPWYDLTVDGSIFIVTARSLAAGEGYTYLGEPFVVRPPGFPLLIAPFVAHGGTNFFALNFFLGLIGAAGVLLLVCARASAPRVLAGSAHGARGLAQPGVPAAHDPGDVRRPRRDPAAPVPGRGALGATRPVPAARDRARPVHRSLGVCPLDRDPAGAGDRRCRACCCAASVEPGAGWRRFAAAPPAALRHRQRARARAVVDSQSTSTRPSRTREQTAIHSYGVGMWHVDPKDPDSPLLPLGAILERIPLRSRQIAHVLGSRMWNEVSREQRAGAGPHRIREHRADTAAPRILAGRAREAPRAGRDSSSRPRWP